MELTGLRILVVEDDDDARELMHAALEQRGAIVSVAENVARAFEQLEHFTPDLVISDIAMPDEDGVTFVRRLRSGSNSYARIPAIAVSAYVASNDRQRAMKAGFDRYLHKPVDFDELMTAIKTVTNRPPES